jgi:hypothetical protein
VPEAGVYAFSIRKSVSWRGNPQGFSNLYHYNLPSPTVAELNAMLTALKNAERPVHDASVTFSEGRAWGPVNANGRGGRMEAVVVFGDAGTKSAGTTFYKELAYLIYWPLGRYGSRNRPQFLRKWIHSQSTGLSAFTGIDGSADIGGATTPAVNYIAAVRNVTPVGGGPTYDLMSASQHIPTGAGQLYKYLEHRQFG